MTHDSMTPNPWWLPPAWSHPAVLTCSGWIAILSHWNRWFLALRDHAEPGRWPKPGHLESTLSAVEATVATNDPAFDPAQEAPSPPASAPTERRPIPGWEGLYEIDRQGRVHSLDRVVTDAVGRSMPRAGQPLKPVQRGAGGWSVALMRGGRRTYCRVDRLRAEAFPEGEDLRP